MPITILCNGCGKRLKAKEGLAGRTLPCPGCGAKVTVPTPEDEAANLLLSEAPTAPVIALPEPDLPDEPIEGSPPPIRKPNVVVLSPLTAEEPPLWLRHLHWLLMLALIPLAFALLQADEDQEQSFERLFKSLESLSPEERWCAYAYLADDEGSAEGLFALLPDQRFHGAYLGRNSLAHWAFAAIAAVVFMTFFAFLASYKGVSPLHLLWVALFTATIGVGVLLIFQTLADASSGIVPRGNGVMVLLIIIAKLIGFSYRAGLDADSGFFLSFVGFTVGVGLCEEVCKATPLLWHYRHSSRMNWRGAFLWGLGSGAGFGIAEGVIYSASQYNGIHGFGIYLVRFISCVALHALWTGSVGITLQQNQEWFQEQESWWGYLLPILRIVAVPMVLHGLYDTLLKKDMTGTALAVAFLSFAFLAFQISRLHTVDDDKATRKMLREYKKRREAM